ncbi:MAG: hypothetical protein WCC47_07585 [Pseudonocardiaceae bacterium]
MSKSDTTQHSLQRDVEALVAALMADAPLAELIAITDRIAAAVDHWDEIPRARSPSSARRSI